MKIRLDDELFTHGNIKAKVKSIYREINKELDDFQNLYDAETNFSRDLDKQEEWMLKITKALQEPWLYSRQATVFVSNLFEKTQKNSPSTLFPCFDFLCQLSDFKYVQ